MTILLHVLIALTSLASAGFTFVSPTTYKLRISYGLVTMTLVSGVYLVASTNSPLLAACTTGLLYLACVFIGLAAAQRKLSDNK